MSQKISSKRYLAPMVNFLKGLPDAIRYLPGTDTAYYGTGESAHWAVQCNQQMLGALAVMAADPDLASFNPAMSAGELRELALQMFRYSLRTHVTGDMKCSDGKQWGRHWISVLGLERAVPGINALEKYFTDDDRERYRNLRVYESDYRLNDYPIRASMDAEKGGNVPESNIWNAGFMMRTAMDYPDLPQGADYLKKATQMMLAGLSYPPDANEQTVYNGKTVAEWYVGPQFTENFSLDHHSYMNVGYTFICLSNLAILYFNFKERGQTCPPEIFHNLERCWKTVKSNFIFPDGRLLRVGGDTRSRYNYCQSFAQCAYVLAAELFHDPDAVRFEEQFLDIVEKEQSVNPDGSFYGKRLSELKDYSYFFYRRLEADPMMALSAGAYWRRLFKIFDESAPFKADSHMWSDDFHHAAVLRTGNVVRSVVCPAAYGPRNPHRCVQEVLCSPLNHSDMAEWSGNLTGYLGLHYKPEHGDIFRKVNEKSFIFTRKTIITEQCPLGEGEEKYDVATRNYACAALPDGKTLLVLERVKIIKEVTLTYGFSSLHYEIPNDVYNDYVRTWNTPDGKSFRTENLPGKNNVIDTGFTRLNCDNAVSFFSLSGETIKIKQTDRQNVMMYNNLPSMYVDEVCMNASIKPVRFPVGETVYDIACAVAADTTAADMTACKGGSVTERDGLKVVSFTAFDGKTYTFTVDFNNNTATLE